MNPILLRFGSQKTKQSANAIATEYMKKQLGLNQASIDTASPEKLKGMMEDALMSCVLQLQAVNEIGQDAKAQQAGDFMKMVHVEKMVVRIQAKFRQRLAIKRLEKDIELQKQKLARKNNANKNVSNEEIALQEFKQRLAKKGLTPEAFYRTVDTHYRKTVSVDSFKKHLANFNL